MNHARLDGDDTTTWSCFKTVAEEGDDSTSSSCVDNDGKAASCAKADLTDKKCESATIDASIRNILADTLEFGCQRFDSIEFTSPKETFVRCTPGWKATWDWDRPSECNLCEDMGFTVEYGCGYKLGEVPLASSSDGVANWQACSESCKAASVNAGGCSAWHFDDADSLGKCRHFDAVNDLTDKVCNKPTVSDSVAGKNCDDEQVCEARICEDCDATGYTKAAACTYSSDFDLPNGVTTFKFDNILTYTDCIAKFDGTPNCFGVTYFTKFVSTANQAAQGVAPMTCIPKGLSTVDQSDLEDELVCNTDLPYNEVISGRKCAEEKRCSTPCDTCDATGFTKEVDCNHSGADAGTVSGVAYFDACLKLCQENTACTTVTFVGSLTGNAEFDADRGQVGDCHMKQNMANTRQCEESTVGLTTARSCMHEKQCRVACGDIDECAHQTHDCDNTVTYDYECKNTLGSYACQMKLFDIIPTLAPTDRIPD